MTAENDHRYCPSCKKGIFNRRLPKCEFCGAPIPLELLMSADEFEESEERADDREDLERMRRSVERATRGERRNAHLRRLGGFIGPLGT